MKMKVILAHKRWEAPELIERLTAEGYDFLDNPFIDIHWTEMPDMIKMFGPRPVVVRTTGNINFVDHLEFKNAQEARDCFYVRREDGSYDQMTEAEAEEFYGSYAAGIEHVSEILRNRGLW